MSPTGRLPDLPHDEEPVTPIRTTEILTNGEEEDMPPSPGHNGRHPEEPPEPVEQELRREGDEVGQVEEREAQLEIGPIIGQGAQDAIEAAGGGDIQVEVAGGGEAAAADPWPTVMNCVLVAHVVAFALF
jgi:hypothetical protein